MIVDLLLDRDGTLIKDSGYIASPDQIEFISGALSGLKKFKSMNFRLHLVSNQSGVGRGIISMEQFLSVESEFESILKLNSIVLDSTNFCFHKPTDICTCRKPKIGLLTAIESKFKIRKDFTGMIGNSKSDRETAGNFGIHYWNIDEEVEDSFFLQSRLVMLHFERIRAEIA